MKKLRLFDSLKLVLATVAFVFAIVSAHAAILPAEYTELEYLESTGTQWINTNVDERTIDYMELKFETVNDSSGFMFVNGASQVGVKDSRYGTSEPGVYIIKQNVLDTKWYFTNETNGTTYTNGRVGSAMLYLFNLNNNGVTNYKNKNVKIYYYKASKNDSLVFDGIPARRDSDGVLGMYDLADANPATAFHTNAGTGEFVAGPVAQIKIATTKYNEESFAPVKTDLSAAVNAVEYVVSNTMTQAQAIDQIATNKQTRPDESCPPFKKCLLVEDEQGVPHWYEIYDPINDFLRPILAAAALSGNRGAPTQTTHTSGSNTIYDTYNGFYKTNNIFKNQYVSGTVSAQNRPFGPTTLPRCDDNATRTAMPTNAGICYNTGGMFRDLTNGPEDDAGEWAVVYNGNEGGASLGITPGVVYGIAKCTSVGQHTTQITGDVQSGSEYWWPKKLAAYSNTTLSSLIEQYPNVVDVFNTLPNPVGTDEKPGYPRENFRNCWCKMTAIGVPGSGGTDEQRYANGTIMNVSGDWVFDRVIENLNGCVGQCAYYCTSLVMVLSKSRKAVFTAN